MSGKSLIIVSEGLSGKDPSLGKWNFKSPKLTSPESSENSASTSSLKI